jgi:AraC-like DNA-binding protein
MEKGASMGETNTDLRETHIIGHQTREQIVDQQTCPPLALHGILMTGISDAAAPFRLIRRQPRLSQVLVTLGGEGIVWADDAWERCVPGSAYLTPPTQPHGYHALTDTRWKFGWVMYDNQPEGLLFRADRPRLVTVDAQPIADAILGLYRESRGPAEPAVMHHWASLVHRYAERVTGEEAAPSRLGALWEQVDEHLSFPWTVTALADRAGTSGEHLRRLCRTALGRSPMRHVASLRMRRAAALLASEAFTIEAIAAQIGYENAFAFSTAFKRHMGLSPSQYRLQKPPR